MKKVYLALAIIGFTIPNIFVLIESIETGNILLYAHPGTTMQNMFANRIASIFAIDLLFAVMVFFIWSYQFKNALGIKRILLTWLATMLFGLAGGLPLFLYLKEKAEAI